MILNIVVVAIFVEALILIVNIYARYVKKPPFVETSHIWRWFDKRHRRWLRHSQWLIHLGVMGIILSVLSEAQVAILVVFMVLNLLLDLFTLFE